MITPVQTIQIENFRGIRKLVFQLHPKVTVLFGANAAGKTSILDAIAIGLGSIVARIPKSTGRDFAKTGDIRIPWKDHAAVGEKQGVECPYTRVEVIAAGGLRWDTTRLRSAQDRKAAPAAVGIKALHDAIDPLVIEVLNAEPGSITSPIPLVSAYGTERAMVDVPLRERHFQTEFHRLGALDHSLRTTTRFKTVFEWFRVMEDEERRERERRRDFAYKLPELEWVRRAVKNAELRCHNPRVETHPIRMLVDFDHGDAGIEPLDIDSLSDGYRTHFSLIVDVARRMVQLNPSDDLSDPRRGTNSEAVILIDEVDLHLDPGWQSRVVSGLTSAFPNAQFVLTTHSEQVIGSVQADSVRKLVWGDSEILVKSVPFAQGATGERILVELMGAPERVAGPVTKQLEEYVGLVGDGAGLGNKAKQLREKLDSALQNEPLLHRADLEMQRQELMAKLEESTI